MGTRTKKRDYEDDDASPVRDDQSEQSDSSYKLDEENIDSAWKQKMKEVSGDEESDDEEAIDDSDKEWKKIQEEDEEFEEEEEEEDDFRGNFRKVSNPSAEDFQFSLEPPQGWILSSKPHVLTPESIKGKQLFLFQLPENMDLSVLNKQTITLPTSMSSRPLTKQYSCKAADNDFTLAQMVPLFGSKHGDKDPKLYPSERSTFDHIFVVQEEIPKSSKLLDMESEELLKLIKVPRQPDVKLRPPVMPSGCTSSTTSKQLKDSSAKKKVPVTKKQQTIAKQRKEVPNKKEENKMKNQTTMSKVPPQRDENPKKQTKRKTLKDDDADSEPRKKKKKD